MSELRKLTKKELTNILEQHTRWLNSNRIEGTRADLSYADLSYADLSFADLSSANLYYANLRSANLSSANLSYANLRSANLSYADLSSANLSSANLYYANLRSANLRFALFRNSRGVSLTYFPVLDWTAVLHSSGQLYIGCEEFDMEDTDVCESLMRKYEFLIDYGELPARIDNEKEIIDNILNNYKILKSYKKLSGHRE